MLFRAIEHAKILLSIDEISRISFKERSLVIDELISRVEFEDMLKEFVDKISASVNQVMSDAGIKNSDVDTVLLTGGSSLIPSIKCIFSSRFGEENIRSTNAFTSVAYGLGMNQSLLE